MTKNAIRVHIKNHDFYVFSFSGKAVWSIAITEVPVQLGLIQKSIEFIVIDIYLPYNAIFGRG